MHKRKWKARFTELKVMIYEPKMEAPRIDSSIQSSNSVILDFSLQNQDNTLVLTEPPVYGVGNGGCVHMDSLVHTVVRGRIGCPALLFAYFLPCDKDSH